MADANRGCGPRHRRGGEPLRCERVRRGHSASERFDDANGNAGIANANADAHAPDLYTYFNGDINADDICLSVSVRFHDTHPNINTDYDPYANANATASPHT
jgi:hypothetical protein